MNFKEQIESADTDATVKYFFEDAVLRTKGDKLIIQKLIDIAESKLNDGQPWPKLKAAIALEKDRLVMLTSTDFQRFSIASRSGKIKGWIEINSIQGLLTFAKTYGRFEFISPGETGDSPDSFNNDTLDTMLYFHDDYD
jgi:hypothetical protein